MMFHRAQPQTLKPLCAEQGEHVTVVEPLSCLAASMRQLVSLQQGRAPSTATNITTLGLGSTLGSPGAAAPSALTVRCAYIHTLGGLAHVY